MNLKRDNWTNEEVIAILEGMRTYDKNGKISKSNWNIAVESCIIQFLDFSVPENDYSAKAFDTQSKRIFMIGPKLPQ